MILTLPQAAEQLSVSLSTVRRLTRSGVLPIIRVSQRRVGIAAEALETYARHGWSAKTEIGLFLSFKQAESAYFAGCQEARQRNKPRRGKRNSAQIFSITKSSDSGPI